jgi:phosphatidate cytidylyltransferase
MRNIDFLEIENFGLFITILVFCSIWVCDSAAFFIGRKFGKHKLIPNVSPNKSVEGAVAGFVFATLFFVIASYLIIPTFNIYYALIIGVTIGIFGQVGDLVESKIKRDVDVKDSGNLIPGHGGMLDRFDSIILVAPIVVIIITIIKLL